MFSFQQLDVWHRSIEFADLVYQATEDFPSHELYGLSNQMRRAAVSISSNLAEGSGRGSNKEFQRFIGISYGSLMERISQLEIARRRRYVSADSCRTMNELGERIARILSGLRESLYRPDNA